jgi:hypothetical protein
MIRLAIKESIQNETGKVKIPTRLNNRLFRQSSLQYVRSNFERTFAIQHVSRIPHEPTSELVSPDAFRF